MLVCVLALFAAALCAPLLVRWFGRWSFTILAAAPAAAFLWTLSLSSQMAAGETIRTSITWIEPLKFNLAFEMDTLSWVLMLLITGIGAIVLMYCSFYFPKPAAGLGLFGGLLTAFAGAMAGLVLADDLLLLFVFWELTTVFSYLLIGSHPERKSSRRAAMKALMVTTFGGLVMFVGFLLIGQQAGTNSISAILDNPPTGAIANVAVVFILVGALSKSALVPFHFWLPSAMAAPTPVSAYLHAAAMVKAGVYLVARFAPGFYDAPPWRPIVIVAGIATVLLGGWQALKQHDLKLLLAFGTVSQLGLLIVLVGVGTPEAAMAGLAMLIAHALFKSALFLSVGVIDHATGTRDFRRLSGLPKAMPWLCAGIVMAALSMAAIPPTAGFVGKEAGLAAFITLSETSGAWASAALGLIVVSAVITVAYSARFVYGVLATRSPEEPAAAHDVGLPIQLPTVVLGAIGVALAFAAAPETSILSPYSDEYGEGDAALYLFHGISLPFVLSIAAILAGLALFWIRDAVERAQQVRLSPLSADNAYHSIMRGLDRLAVEVTGATQRGSLPTYLSVILVVVVAIPGAVMVATVTWPRDVQLFDSPAQVLVGGLMIAAAIAAVRSRRRLKAVALLGVTGYGTAILFVLHGAPDLALTQVLVETVTIVFFVLGLRKLPPYFSNRPLKRSRYLRATIGILVGACMSGFTYLAVSARNTIPISVEYPEEAVDFGGGKNIVNVALVDIRAWDTMGEISVLVVAATGVASLIFLRRRNIQIIRPADVEPGAEVWAGSSAGGGVGFQAARSAIVAGSENNPDLPKSTFIRAGRTLAPERRSVILEVIVRLSFHTMIVFAIYLLFAGHNRPGGGFAAGIVVGIALLTRYLAGGRYELSEAVPFDAGLLLGPGLLLATCTGLASFLFGAAFLESTIFDLHLPIVGDIHLATSLFFDIGVFMVVVGLMLDVLRSLGAEIDEQEDSSSDPTPALAELTERGAHT